MKLNTLTSVKNEVSQIDLGVISNILNDMRRKSGLTKNWVIPPIHIRWWTMWELLDRILKWKYIATWQLFQSPEWENLEINIIVPPFKITTTNRYTFTLIHELVHSFWKNIQSYNSPWCFQNLNEWLTDIIAAQIYVEYCYRIGIPQEIHNISYLWYATKVLKITEELQKRWYGDSEMILKWFIQWYFAWINMIDTLKDLSKWDVNINDILFLTQELLSF